MTFTHTAYDLVILGSGSTAFAAALHAAERGKTVVMTEERTVGVLVVHMMTPGCLGMNRWRKRGTSQARSGGTCGGA